MKNKMLFIFLLLIGSLFISSLPIKVNAEVYKGEIATEEYISNVYIRKLRPDGSSQYKQAKILRQSTDNAFVYCLQPFVEIDNNYKYNVTRSDYETYLDMTAKQWDKVSLIAYYGYGYGNHTAKKWWAITQVMIWRVADPSGDYFFTKTLNGEKSSEYDDEIKEIETLVANHNKKPKFNIEDEYINIGQSITLTDSNKILNEFKISSQSNVNAVIKGNTISIEAKEIGDVNIKLAKEDSLYESPPIVYFSDKSQDVLKVGSFDPIYSSINLKVVGTKVKVVKNDSETKKNNPQGLASLTGAEYGIYNADSDELVEKIVTDEEAVAISNYLPSFGEYYVKEIKPSFGYKLDNQKYYFTVDENTSIIELGLYEDIIKRDFEFTKVFSSNRTGKMVPEAGVKFAIYDRKDNLILELETDSEGKMYFSLPYGEYILKQITSPKNYEKIDDYYFEVKEEGSVINEVFCDSEITARLKVIKRDLETNNIIKISGIKFKIFDLVSNEYVKQTITYPNNEVVDTFSTNEEGYFITPYPLSSGKYRLEEVNQEIDGYVWNNNHIEFEIGENVDFLKDNVLGNILEVDFYNSSVKGSVEVLKYGEEVVIDNNKYNYQKIKLDDVKFNLYAANDIYSSDGTLIYVKDQYISTHITIDGYFKIENMYLGDYYLIEKETTTNHVLDSSKHYFSLKYKDQYTKVISVNLELYNYLNKGSLEFTKLDLVTGKTLPNTKIQVFNYNEEDDAGNMIFEGITDENGNIIIDNLFVGKFYIIESEAPPGYTLNNEKIFFEIKSNGEIIKAEMTNEKIIVKVPDTNLDESYNLYFFSLTLALIGGGLLIYGIKRKK